MNEIKLNILFFVWLYVKNETLFTKCIITNKFKICLWQVYPGLINTNGWNYLMVYGSS